MTSVMDYIVRIFVFLMTTSVASSSFGYHKCLQHAWVEKHKLCTGKFQSPIAISSSRAIPKPLPALEMVGFRNYLPKRLIMKNNGHSVEIRSHNKLEKEKNPYIFGAGFGKNEEYQMDHMHFHWGRKNNKGSEHTLNGISYPMEMHMVHINKAYNNLSHALNFKNGLAVLGIFFQLQEDDNEVLNPILRDLTIVQDINTDTELTKSMIPSLLLPRNIDLFYTYKGSLTTPPCSEVVTWIIFPTPVPISFRQMNKFRLLSTNDGRRVGNYRKLQEIGSRKVYVRLLGPKLLTDNSSVVDAASLSWF